MSRCGGRLWKKTAAEVGDVEFCFCGCNRAWKLRWRTTWNSLAFWLRKQRGTYDDRVWVRLSSGASQRILIDRERAW
jgi:hypothetical protein